MTSHLPCELRAVLDIFSHDKELQRKALPHVDIERQSIDWDAIFGNDYGSGHRAAVLWAYAIWADHAPAKGDPISAAFSMGSQLRLTVLHALATRWGLPPVTTDKVRNV